MRGGGAKHDEAETALAALRAACTEDEQEATQAAAAAARARLDAARTEIRASKDAASLAAAASTVEQLPGDDAKAVAAELSGALVGALKTWLEGAEAEALCAGARELSLAPPGGLAVDNLARERAAHAALQQLLALGARVDAARGTRTECAALLQARATRWCDGQLAAAGRLAGQQSTLGAAALSEAVATASAAAAAPPRCTPSPASRPSSLPSRRRMRSSPSWRSSPPPNPRRRPSS